MLYGIFEIESEEIDDICLYYNKTSQDINSTNDESKINFKPLKSAEVFGNGAQKINNQLDLFSEKFMLLSNALQKCKDRTFDEEYHLRDEIRNIQIPKGFDVNDSSHSNTFDNIALSKDDGRSVNDGKELFDNTEEFNSSVKYNNNLQDFNNDGGKQEQNINFKLDGNMTKLEDITSGDLNKQNINFRLDGDMQRIQNIDGGNLQEQQINFNTNQNNVNLANIDKSNQNNSAIDYTKILED